MTYELSENAVNVVDSDSELVYVPTSKSNLLWYRNPQRQQGRLTQLKSDCVIPR